MIWIGLVVGIVIGAGLWGMPGAVVLGFFGWLAGVIVKSRSRDVAASIPAAQARPETLEARVMRLERAVALLEARVPGGAPLAADAAPPDLAVAVAATEPRVEPVAVVEEKSPEMAVFPPSVPAVTEPPSREPVAPNPFMAWLAGGNTIARVGLLILFIGFAFLLKYAADHSMLPVELRVASVAAGGIVLLVLGWRLRERRRGYALGLQGAGVAVLYLTTFAALRLWGLLPAEAAFALLAAIAVFSAILAIRQDALVLAVFGAGGGFLAPILTSTGGGSHVMLFSYYLLLNLGIAAVALYKAWRPLNLLGFLFTFFIGLAWGLKFYRPEHFDTTEPFLIVFFVLYVAIAVLFARRQAPELRNYVDGTLVFGAPLAAFGLQAGLVRGMEFALAFSSLGLAALYIALAAALRFSRRENYTLLAEAFIALGVVFSTAAIPLALDARWTSAAWALEGAAIVWIGIRQHRTLARAFGLLLQVLAGGAYLNAYRAVPDAYPLLDSPFVGAVLLAIAGFWIHRLLLRSRDEVSGPERQLVPFAFVWAAGWWIFAGHHEIVAFVPRELTLNAHIVFLAATALALGALALRWQWVEATWAALSLLPVLVLFALVSFAGHSHPFAHYGGIAWPFAVATHLWILRRLEPEGYPRYADTLHAGAMVLVAALGAVELHWVAETFTARGTAWSVASVAVVPALLVLLASSRWAESRWPVMDRGRAYHASASVAIVLALVAWSFYANATHDGRSDPLPYLPLLNALDLAQILAGLAAASAWMALRRMSPPFAAMISGRAAAAIGGVVAFVWLNGILLRSLHHWADVPYHFDGVTRSVLAQASLSIFWSALALAIMVVATRIARRPLWMVGAALMAVVVAKLFLVDLSHVGGIERIVSFIAVGVLMLVIGYFSPVPPRKPENSA